MDTSCLFTGSDVLGQAELMPRLISHVAAHLDLTFDRTKANSSVVFGDPTRHDSITFHVSDN